MFEHVAQLEEKIEVSKSEHAEAFNEVADYTQKATADHLDLQKAQASADRSSQRVVELETDNALLQRRLAELAVNRAVGRVKWLPSSRKQRNSARLNKNLRIFRKKKHN